MTRFWEKNIVYESQRHDSERNSNLSYWKSTVSHNLVQICTLINENVNLTQNRNYYVDEDYYLMNWNIQRREQTTIQNGAKVMRSYFWSNIWEEFGVWLFLTGFGYYDIMIGMWFHAFSLFTVLWEVMIIEFLFCNFIILDHCFHAIKCELSFTD